MATTYKLIDKSILTSSQSSVSFTGLGAYSSDYKDLLVRVAGRTDRSAKLDYIKISFNGVTTNLSSRRLYAFGTTVGSDTPSTSIQAQANAANNTANTFGNVDFYIPNYSSSNYKSVSVDGVIEDNSTADNDMALSAGLWSSTSAITSIQITPNVGPNFVSGSSFYLYGIKNS